MHTHCARRRSVRRAFALKIFICLALSLSLSPATSRQAQGEEFRRFTIQDSIELSYFINPVLWTVNQDPPTGPIVSPDGKYLLVITQRGILATNKTESSIWIFDRHSVQDFAEKRSSEKPRPRPLVTWHATSNTPVLSDVRWLRDSRHVAFLARMEDGTLQLFTVDTATGKKRQLSQTRQSVSAYDIQGRTIAYTTFDDNGTSPTPGDDLVDVTGKNIFSVLWEKQALRDRDESLLLTVPNTLHVLRNVHESEVKFSFEGKPLKLFFPVLSISPDQRFLVTVAPVTEFPSTWQKYEPRFGYEDLRLDPNNRTLFGSQNAWKPSEFVLVDLQTGLVTPMIDAPAGRSVFHIFAPTKAIWSPDSLRVLLANTFLPLDNNSEADEKLKRTAPAVTFFDLQHHHVDAISFLPQPARGSSPTKHVSDVVWNTAGDEVELRFSSTPDNVSLAFRKTYKRANSGWLESESAQPTDNQITIYQDLNRSPVLVAGSSLIWDPNPYLANVALGKASLYQWHDVHGNLRRGILVLPASYTPGHRYPLVIQTHGVEPNRFFADGIYTTGSGGRALCGRGIIVLQTEQYSKTADPQLDAEVQIEAFRSAIQQLSTDGLVDAKKVGIIGFSFTVYHTLYGITRYPELFAAASITDGNDLSYWLYLMWTDIPFAQQMAEAANGGVKPFGKEGLSKWQQSAPGFNLDRVQAPLLISCLEEGTLVGTWDIYGGLRTLNKPVDLLWLKKEDAPHVLVQPHQRYLSQGTAVDWFDFWLNGHEDPSTQKEEQYLRWRALRSLVNNSHQSSAVKVHAQ